MGLYLSGIDTKLNGGAWLERVRGGRYGEADSDRLCADAEASVVS